MSSLLPLSNQAFNECQAPTYEEALAYLFADLHYNGRAHKKYDNPERGLERMREILARLGNPHQRYQTLHITGTKGKGSTSAYCESILRHLGYRTGLFTSPHLHTFRERMRVDGQLIGRAELAELVARLRPHFEAVPDLSIFDKITALAFQHFAEAGVEWAVVEVGLGGRLDSTNVILPDVCGITRISKDHTHVLGETLTQIATEKAGIIKRGVPVFSAPQHAAAQVVLEATAAARQTSLHIVQPLEGMEIPLVGRHQQINAAIAWHMVSALAAHDRLRCDPARAAAGLAATWWPGRFEMLPGGGSVQPPLLVDCAHNVDSVEILLETLAQFHPDRPITFIFGANRDKRMLPMIERLLAVSPRFVLVQSRHPKSLMAETILQELQPLVDGRTHTEAPLHVQVAPSMVAAIELAVALTPPHGLMVGTGSVFVAAELREAWNVCHPDLFPPDDWVHEVAAEPLITSPVSAPQR